MRCGVGPGEGGEGKGGSGSSAVSGELRTMCGSRTGGWSLPSVMSD
jgi:hypothetical protein